MTIENEGTVQEEPTGGAPAPTETVDNNDPGDDTGAPTQGDFLSELGVNFGEEDDDDSSVVAQAEPKEAPPPANTEQEEEPSGDAPVAEPEAPKLEAAPEPKPEAKEPPVEEPKAEAPKVEPTSEEAKAEKPQTAPQFKEVIEQHRTQLEKYTAEQVFKLDDEATERLATEPEKVIPELMSKVFYETMLRTYEVVTRTAPALVNAALEEREKAQTFENQFFEKFPVLKDAKYRDTINQTAAVYNQMNPKASREEFMNFVGAAAMANLGLVAQHQNGKAEPPAQKVVQQVPFVPAGRSAPSAGTPQMPDNPFEQMAALMEAHDDE